MKLIITTNKNYKFELNIETKTEAEKGGKYNKQLINKNYYKVNSAFCNTWFSSINELTNYFSKIYLYKTAICK
jgi:hypothetical protein